MLKLRIDVQVTGAEDWKPIAQASAATDIAEGTASSLGYYASSLASILGDTLTVEVGKALALTKDGEDNGE